MCDHNLNNSRDMNYKKQCLDLIMDYTHDNNIMLTRIKIHNFDFQGEHFCSGTARITIWYEENEKEYERVLFGKFRLPYDAIQNQIINCNLMFDNEINAYKTVIPALQAVNNDVKLPFPKIIAMAENCLILDNLSKRGFAMANKVYGLSFNESRSALKKLAEYHCRSVVMKENNKSHFESIVKNIKESVLLDAYVGGTMDALWENAIWCAHQSLKKFPELSEVFLPYCGQALNTLIRSVKSSETFSVICHGDLWCNNLMFCYEKPHLYDDVRLVDLQAMRYTSCALDILYLICTSTEEGLIGKTFYSLIDAYFLELKLCCEREKTQMPFSKNELIDEIKEKISYGIIVGSMIILCCTAQPYTENTLNYETINSAKYKRHIFESLTDCYHKRLRQLIIDLKTLNFI